MAESSDPSVYISLEDREPTSGRSGGGHQLQDNDKNSNVESPDAPNALLSRNLWGKRRSSKKRREKLRQTSSKDVSKYVDVVGGLDQALLTVITEKELSKFPEVRVGLFVSELLQRGASILCTDEHGNTPLHLAAQSGFPEVGKELLKWDADPLLENKKGQTPLEISVHLADDGLEENIADHNAFAIIMIHEMESEKVREMFLCEAGNPPKLNFHKMLNNDDMQDTVKAVLDTLIERVPGHKRTYTVYYDVLEANENGRIVRNQSKFSLRRQLGKSAFDEIAWRGNKEAVSHLAVRLLMQSKWKRFARNSLILHFIYWAILMAVLSCALILAAIEEHPELYDQPVDIFRGICEGLTLLLLTSSALTELYHIYLWRLDYFKDYSFFIYNYLNIATMVFVVVLIPLRAVDLDVQWIFASFVYVSYSLRVFRYVHAIQTLGKYVQILYHILVRDMVPFLAILIVTLFIFTGGFYFALREEVMTSTVSTASCNVTSISSALQSLNVSVNELNTAISNTTANSTTSSFMTSLDINPYETSTYPRVFFTGIRLAVEGQNFLVYFGPNGFGWLGVSTYLILLFFVEVVLLNLLIAQMSDTFSTVQGDAQRALAINQARTIISIERTGLSILKFLTDFYISEEKWTNPQKHVERLDTTSITNIHRVTQKMQKIVKQHTDLLEDLRDALAEQRLSTNEKLDLIMKKLSV